MADPLTTSATSLGFLAAPWLISPLLSRLLNECFDELDIDSMFRSQKETLLYKLEDLRTRLLPKLLILTDVTDASQDSFDWLSLAKWLQELKSAFYEAEHVFRLVEYRRLEKEVNSLFPSTSKYNFNKLRGKLLKFSSEKKYQKYLIKSLENLKTIVNQGINIVDLLNLPISSGNTIIQSSNDQYRETISMLGSTIIGREKDRDYIVNLLREDSPESSSNTKCYSVIGIWGMGGLGKTTLAQYVYDHEKEVEYFDRVIWVHVSQKFRVDAILRNIWESGFKENCPKFGNLGELQFALQEKLRGERYFLVLDDVWCDKGVEQKLEQLFVPLRTGKRGSKILVTTRIEAAAKALGAMNLIPLRELDDHEFFSLFMSNAIGDVQISDKHIETLISIGKKIAAKLHRSPFAAKTVAAQLRVRLDPEFWASMLNRSLLNDTRGALFLSYQYLPPPLQRCFAFCSLFPKGHRFEHDHLVNLWIAEGFIESKDSNEHMKDIGNQYILELISSSFFQVEKWDSKFFSMNDLIHDLAQNVSEGEYFRIEGDEKKEIPAHARHISVANHMLSEYVDEVCKLKDLRTIIVFDSNGDPPIILKEGDLDALFTKLRKLYVVEIEGISLDVKRVPKSVVQLRNLRYLKFKYLNLDAHSISLLYQLRFLSTKNPIPNVGRLRTLNELTDFRVRMKRGFELKQLEHLKDLYGSLSISGLNNVKSKEEAYQAKLSDKKGLRKLLFRWDYRRNIDAEILDGLCPPPQIKELAISNYSGKMLPNWISKNNNSFIHLEHLKLFSCHGLEALHGIDKLSDLLSLTIRIFPRLKIWVPLPSNLTQLEIYKCLPLAFAVKEDLDKIMSIKGERISRIVNFKEKMNDRMEDSHYDVLSIDYHFKCVQEMMKLGDHIEEETLSTISKDLNKCLEKRLDLICQLRDIYGEPFLPPLLEWLSIGSCFITDKILAGSLEGLTKLTYLKLEYIITVTCIPKEVLSSLTNLRTLDINGCLLLTSIGGLDSLSTLEYLNICLCPNLMTLETSSSRESRTRSSTLKCVELWGCMLSDDLLQGLISGLMTLEKLCVSDFPTIKNPYMGHFKALSVLYLSNCPNLASLRGLNELTNLERLEVLSGCDKLKCDSDADKLPRLKELRIYRFSLLEQLVSKDGFSSLVSLEFYGAQQEYFSEEECDEMFCSLSSLTKIWFWDCKMRSLPNLTCLRSLIFLEIIGCKNLSSLPDVPPSVQRISIRSCNIQFRRSCEDPKDSNGRKISHIPQKNIWD